MLNRFCTFVLDANWIFLKADELSKVLLPKLLKFTKFRILVLSVGERTRCAGVDVLLFKFFDLKLFQNVFDWFVAEEVVLYFNEFPVTEE